MNAIRTGWLINTNCILLNQNNTLLCVLVYRRFSLIILMNVTAVARQHWMSPNLIIYDENYFNGRAQHSSLYNYHGTFYATGCSSCIRFFRSIIYFYTHRTHYYKLQYIISHNVQTVFYFYMYTLYKPNPKLV